MPTSKPLPYIQFIGGNTDPKRLQQLKSMLTAVGVPSGVKQIIVESPIGMKQARQMYNVPDNRPAFSIYNDGRVYIDQDTLDNPKMTNDYLLHEFGHFAAGAYPKKGNQDQLNDSQIQQMENEANKGAKPFRDAYKEYRSNQKDADANYDLQSRVASESNQFQTTPAAIQTQLVSPNSSATLSAPYKGSVQSVLDRAPQTTYAQRVMASKPYQSYADKVMASKPYQSHADRVMASKPVSKSE